MRVRRIRLLPALLLSVLCAGCLMPTRGTPVVVDMRAGEFWSGYAMLVEVSQDQQQCRVSVRDKALFVRDLWVACSSVHPRTSRASRS